MSCIIFGLLIRDKEGTPDKTVMACSKAERLQKERNTIREGYKHRRWAGGAERGLLCRHHIWEVSGFPTSMW